MVAMRRFLHEGDVAGKFMLTVFCAITQSEREYILDRKRDGIEIARQNGK